MTDREKIAEEMINVGVHAYLEKAISDFDVCVSNVRFSVTTVSVAKSLQLIGELRDALDRLEGGLRAKDSPFLFIRGLSNNSELSNAMKPNKGWCR